MAHARPEGLRFRPARAYLQPSLRSAEKGRVPPLGDACHASSCFDEWRMERTNGWDRISFFVVAIGLDPDRGDISVKSSP
jgi:hypothetical protein